MLNRKTAVPILFITLIVITSGCVNFDAKQLAAASPMIQGFLEEYPNAEIIVTRFTAGQVETIINQIRDDCNNELIEAKDLYKVAINDADSGFSAFAWIDYETQDIICAWKVGTEGKEIDKDSQECSSHYKAKCKDGSVYWFDSCDEKEEKKEYCANGCDEEKNECKSGSCTAHHEVKCNGQHVYWFDSCGKAEKKKEYCEHGCLNSECKSAGDSKCDDTDGGKDYHVKGTATTLEKTYSDHCNKDGTLTEKYCEGDSIKAETYTCPEGSECSDGACTVSNILTSKWDLDDADYKIENGIKLFGSDGFEWVKENYMCCKRVSTETGVEETTYSLVQTNCDYSDENTTIVEVSKDNCYENMVCCRYFKQFTSETANYQWDPTPSHCRCFAPGCIINKVIDPNICYFLT